MLKVLKEFKYGKNFFFKDAKVLIGRFLGCSQNLQSVSKIYNET